MKKNLILPLVLLCAVMIWGVEKKISFSSSLKNENTAIFSLDKETRPSKKKFNNLERESRFLDQTPASVTWPLYTNLTTHSIEGNLTTSISYSGNLYSRATTASQGYLTVDGTAVDTMVFNEGTSSSNSWTASASIDENKYVQFDVASTNGILTINKVEMIVAGAQTNSMYVQIYYSTDPTFATKTLLKEEYRMNPNNAAHTLTLPLATEVVLGTSENFYVRVYPYVKSATTNKYFIIRDLKISGTMEGTVVNPATVSTTAVSSISTTNAISGGTISSNGGGEITESGIVWSTNENPTISDPKTNENATTGTFVSSLSGLAAGTTYYVRAYAINSAGTAYGNPVSFTTLSSIIAPTVTTTSQSQVTNKSFVVSGNVTDWGGADVTDRGIVYSKTANPTVDNATKISTGTGTGVFSSYAHGVDASTLYYVRTFATNLAGTSYGSTATVITKATDPDVVKTINQDGSADYTTVQAAFDAVPDNYTGRWIIHIKPGTYTERPTLAQNKANVFLIGDDATTTVITNNISAGDINPDTGNPYGTSNSQTMAIFGNDFAASKITIANTFVNSVVNTQINPATQAIALKTQGDRQAFYDCRILGYQDTYLGNSIGRAYFKNCYIEGNVDFIFGRQTVVFDHCTTYINRNNSVIVAPSTESSTKYGMVFLDCNLTVPAAGTTDFNGTIINNFHFGRPWQNRPKAAFIRCEVPAMLNPVGWTTMNAGLNPIFVEYGNTGAGATPERLAQRGNEGIVLTEEESQVYTISNVFKKDTDPSFLFDWIPAVNIDTSILAVNDVNNTAKVTVYPNPFTNMVNIVHHLNVALDISVEIYDVNGRMVKRFIHKGKSGQNDININTDKLNSGIYFYNIKTNNGQTNGKLIRK